MTIIFQCKLICSHNDTYTSGEEALHAWVQDYLTKIRHAKVGPQYINKINEACNEILSVGHQLSLYTIYCFHMSFTVYTVYICVPVNTLNMVT